MILRITKLPETDPGCGAKGFFNTPTGWSPIRVGGPKHQPGRTRHAAGTKPQSARTAATKAPVPAMNPTTRIEKGPGAATRPFPLERVRTQKRKGRVAT